jgi:hypothetical protein
MHTQYTYTFNSIAIQHATSVKSNYFLHPQMAFSMNQDKMLSLNEFDEEMSDTFSSSDCCSSNDSVARWHSQFGGKDNLASDTGDSILDRDDSVGNNDSDDEPVQRQ